MDLLSFATEPSGAGLLVSWETASEIDNLGFHLYRQAGQCPLERLNPTLIPSRAPGQGQGTSYSFWDTTVRSGVAYAYVLEDVDADGRRTAHGPIEATAPYTAFLPIVNR